MIIFTAAIVTQAAETPDGVTPKRIVILDDIAYRSGSSHAWKLDLAMPENYSPVSYISANALPFLLIQGTADRIVNPKATDDFVAKM